MLNNIFLALWFFLPAGLANAAPVLAKYIPLLNKWRTPIDCGWSYKGLRLLGDNKTWRGLITGTLIAVLTIILQKYLYSHSSWLQQTIPPIDYTTVSWLLGALLGAGALIGDSIESFFKRRVGVASGEPWFPFDQIDYIIGGILASLMVIRLSLIDYLYIIIVWFGLHLLMSYVAFLLKLKDKPL